MTLPSPSTSTRLADARRLTALAFRPLYALAALSFVFVAALWNIVIVGIDGEGGLTVTSWPMVLQEAFWLMACAFVFAVAALLVWTGRRHRGPASPLASSGFAVFAPDAGAAYATRFRRRLSVLGNLGMFCAAFLVGVQSFAIASDQSGAGGRVVYYVALTVVFTAVYTVSAVLGARRRGARPSAGSLVAASAATVAFAASALAAYLAASGSKLVDDMVTSPAVVDYILGPLALVSAAVSVAVLVLAPFFLAAPWIGAHAHALVRGVRAKVTGAPAEPASESGEDQVAL